MILAVDFDGTIVENGHWPEIGTLIPGAANALRILHSRGHKRAGCIMCPLACRQARVRDYNAYPQHVRAIERALGAYLSMRERERERAFLASIIGVLTHTKSSITGCMIPQSNQQKALAYLPTLEVI